MRHRVIWFDIDGTMLLDDAYTHGAAMVRGTERVFDVSLPSDAVMRIAPWGKTDTLIGREILQLAGRDDFDLRFVEWCSAVAQEFSSADRQGWIIRRDLRSVLRHLLDNGLILAPLTGNLRAVAVTKLQAMNVADCFDLGKGAFGDDAERRIDLGPVAVRRAAPVDVAASWVVGDTAADYECAHGVGARCVLFRGPHSISSADAVVEEAAELLPLLTSS